MATRVVAVGRRLRQGWRCRRRLVRRVIRRLQRALFLFQASKPPVDSCCPRCSHAMRPQDHPVKFMLFVCASCGHQKQLDFEFSWRETYVNGIRILPQVKDQGDETTCVFFAIATAIEAMLNMEMAQRGERYSESISISDMVEYFENCKWESSVPKKMELGLAKIKTCLEMLQTIGALTQKGKKKPEELLQVNDKQLLYLFVLVTSLID
ncbi:uncharacterized protein LOC123446589 isoform X1 [Hordeum vulgare subsp. vulgare]|uniref:uncharacterized protein LOC123446589 isoform X1 n=1 Tax=Hordeum vulgare subsp. vulgare TaxID=112509 RepID=UPI001D1A565F|nr:uncharacterized protein LOC123446589 isoform X1 [Hordeum vulgare subsp. vulgare]